MICCRIFSSNWPRLGAELQNEKAFVFRLAHNLAMDWLRRRKVRWDSEERLIRGTRGRDSGAA